MNSAAQTPRLLKNHSNLLNFLFLFSNFVAPKLVFNLCQIINKLIQQNVLFVFCESMSLNDFDVQLHFLKRRLNWKKDYFKKLSADSPLSSTTKHVLEISTKKSI
jgi:hypothetical protein